MKRGGFTLAEVLITLAIVGVVAALTIPTVTTNVESRKAGPALTKAVNSLSAAVRYTLDQRRLPRLSDITDFNFVNDVLQAHMTGNPADADAVTYRQYENPQAEFAFNHGTAYTTKDGIIYYVSDTGTAGNSGLRKYSTEAPQIVYIDINGPSNPNMIGKDLFRVDVDMKGEVIPYGGRQYGEFIGDNAILWQAANTACNDQSVVADASACTGSIADNGWTVTYRWR